MEIKDIQERAVEAVNFRCEKIGIERTEDILMIHLIEEFGELAKQLMNEKLKKKEINVTNAAEEISDCLILLFNLADHFGINLEKSLSNKIEGAKLK